MKSKVLIIAISFFFIQKATAQVNLYSEDIPRFFQAFDSLSTTKDTLKQIEFVKSLYIDKASKGLKDFMRLRENNTIEMWKYAVSNKQNITEKRPWMLSVMEQQAIIKKKVKKFKKIYPDFREGDVYFCVGRNNSGGTIFDKTVYIGTEVLATDKDNWAVFLALHEFTHTQQWTQRNILRLQSDTTFLNDYKRTHTQLLGQCLEEGMADFVAELVNGEDLAKTNPFGHTAFGLKNEQAVWNEFKKEIFLPFDYSMGWLYAKREINGEKISDLGYFVGHQICKSYYNKSKNKKQALKEMLALNLKDDNSKKFLIASGYLTAKEIEQLK